MKLPYEVSLKCVFSQSFFFLGQTQIRHWFTIMFYVSKRNQRQILPCAQSQEVSSLHVPCSLRRGASICLADFLVCTVAILQTLPADAAGHEQVAGRWGPAVLLRGAVTGGTHAVGLVHSSLPESRSPSGPPLGGQFSWDQRWADSCEARAPAPTAWFWQNP